MSGDHGGEDKAQEIVRRIDSLIQTSELSDDAKLEILKAALKILDEES